MANPLEEFTECVSGDTAPTGAKLTLPFERRQKARQRAKLDSGEEVALMLPRGTVMRGGDRLISTNGRSVSVIAADESVSRVECDDAQGLARIAYHLGNRHVAVQVGSHWLRYLADHVLDDMVVGLGAAVQPESAPFEPEVGAYASHGQAHSH